MARTKEQKMAAVYEKFMEDPAKQLSPSESAAVMAHLGTVVAAQEKTMRQQQETISTLKEELETLKSALEDNAKAVSMFDSLPDEILLDIIKVAARHGADQQGRHSTSGQWRGEGGPYPPIASSRLAILGSPEYNHDFIVDVIGKISKRFSRLAHDKSLWTGTVVISLDGDMRHELGGWEYGEKTADKIIFEWLHDGTEHLWMDGENPCTKVATFDFHSLAKRCPKLKTLLLYSVELEESLKSSKFQMPYLENLFLHVVDLSYSDPFDGFDWQFTFPSIKLFGMWPDMTPGEYGDGWSLFPDLRDCHNLKEVYVMGGKYSFPTNLSEDVPFPRCLKKLVLHDHGLTNYKWYVKNGMKTLNSQEIRDAIEEYLPNCGMFYENLGCRNSPINCVPSDDSEYEDDEDDEDEEDDDEEEEEGEEDNEEEEEEVEEEEEQENDDHVDNVGESVDTSEEEGTEEESDWDRNHDELSTFGTHSKAYKHLDYRVGIRSNCHGNKKALLIGINYFGQSRELNGCVNDVANMKKLILTRGYQESAAHMRVLTDDSRIPTNQPTKRNIIEGIQWLLNDAQPDDSFVLFFSGHGGQTLDQDGDEADGLDEFICPVDYKSAGNIVDDELKSLLTKLLPRGVRLTAFFDSCHSQTVLDLPYIYDCHGNIKNTSKRKTRSIKGDVILFAACKDSQTSADDYIPGFGYSGACSYALVKALSQGGNPTYVSLLAIMRKALRSKYSQKIQLSSNFNYEIDMNTPFII